MGSVTGAKKVLVLDGFDMAEYVEVMA